MITDKIMKIIEKNEEKEKIEMMLNLKYQYPLLHLVICSNLILKAYRKH